MEFEKDYIKAENKKLIEIRDEFFAILDDNLPKDSKGNFDFDNNPTLDAKVVYENLFKLDYQARKLRALLGQTYELHKD
ncbi:MAG TPA: hypothetical protein EYG69_01605 [Campylobacterales bacterium]|nr:hypothetical protein [Campylobacterales bacterium]